MKSKTKKVEGSYTVKRVTSNRILLSTKGRISATMATDMLLEVQDVVGEKTQQNVVFDSSKGLPEGLSTVRAVSKMLKNLTQVDRLAIVGVRGPKAFIFRMLIQFVGRLDYEVCPFGTMEEADAWLNQ